MTSGCRLILIIIPEIKKWRHMGLSGGRYTGRNIWEDGGSHYLMCILSQIGSQHYGDCRDVENASILHHLH